MWLRRAFYYAQFGAIPILPLWLLIGRGLVVEGPGWEFVLLLVVCPILVVAMAIVVGITVARKNVRRTRRLSWLDVGVLGAWYLAIIAAGTIAHTGMAVLVVVLSVAAFWSALWQLYTETRRRVESALAAFPAIPVGEYRASAAPRSPAAGNGPVIRIEPGPR
jgi:uncharacterized BrkB/YihY/UPF0761 family membrane protein